MLLSCPICKPKNVLIINVPVVMILMRATSITKGRWKRSALKIGTFLGPEMTTINAPLIYPAKGYLFTRAKYIIEGFFEGAQTFLNPKLS